MSLSGQQELEEKYMMSAFGRWPVQFVRGEGMWLYDDEGKARLDFLSGLGAVCLGHADKDVATAIAKQAETLVHVGNYFYIPGRGELAEKVSLLLNGGDVEALPYRLFFANSGAEANEGAIKIARKHGNVALGGRSGIISLKRSFHGRTLATTAATGQAAKQEAFAPMPEGFIHVEPGDVAALEAAFDAAEAAFAGTGQGGVAAVMLECVQGEGGVWPLDPDYIRAVREASSKREALLIVDEVQTGFCRTGEAFAFQHAGIRPDVVSIAKGIANGFPCAAVAACGAAGELIVPGEHGSTFGGGPLAVAAANATVDKLIATKATEHAREVGAYFASQLEGLPRVAQVRGLGLMLGVSLEAHEAQEAPAPVVAMALLDRGFVVANIGCDILRFLPPLIVSKEEVDQLITALRDCLEAL